MSNRTSPHQAAPFLVKTYDIVDDASSNSVVAWASDGASFIVYKPVEFARDLLPKYFKHNNFSSFVRQLNTYGFRKVDSEQWQFANEGFIRGEPELLPTILRRKPAHHHEKAASHDSGSLTSVQTAAAQPQPGMPSSSSVATGYGGSPQQQQQFGSHGRFGPFPHDLDMRTASWPGNSQQPGFSGAQTPGAAMQNQHMYSQGPNLLSPPAWMYPQMQQHQMQQHQMQQRMASQLHQQQQFQQSLQWRQKFSHPQLPPPADHPPGSSGAPTGAPSYGSQPSSVDVIRSSPAPDAGNSSGALVLKREDVARPYTSTMPMPRNLSAPHLQEVPTTSLTTSLQSPAVSEGRLNVQGTQSQDRPVPPKAAAPAQTTMSAGTVDTADSSHRKRKLNSGRAATVSEEAPLERSSLHSTLCSDESQRPGETTISSELLKSVLDSVGKLSMDVARLKHENQALTSTFCALDQPDGKDGGRRGTPREAKAAGQGRPRDLEVRLKAQEDWKASVDKGMAAQAQWQAAMDRAAQATDEWRSQHASRTVELLGLLSEQQQLADRDVQRARHLEQRVAWQEKLSHDQLELNQRSAVAAAEQSRKACADSAVAVVLEERLALQERQHAQQQALNRMLEARVMQLEGQLASSSAGKSLSYLETDSDSPPMAAQGGPTVGGSGLSSNPGRRADEAQDPYEDCEESVVHVSTPPPHKLPPKQQFSIANGTGSS